mgnify:FL=1
MRPESNAPGGDPDGWCLTPPAPSAARLFEAHFQEPAAGLGGAVQRGLCGAGIVAFHFDEAEAFAFSAEDVRGDVDGPHGAIGREHAADGFFSRIARQVSYEEFFQESGSLDNGGRKKKTPRGAGFSNRIKQPLRWWLEGPWGRLRR